LNALGAALRTAETVGLDWEPDPEKKVKPAKAENRSAPALSILAELPRVEAFVIAGESAGTKDEEPRADLKRPWADRGLVLHLSHGAKQLTASGLRKRRSCD
jgi:hypothetical protein